MNKYEQAKAMDDYPPSGTMHKKFIVKRRRILLEETYVWADNAFDANSAWMDDELTWVSTECVEADDCLPEDVTP